MTSLDVRFFPPRELIWLKLSHLLEFRCTEVFHIHHFLAQQHLWQPPLSFYLAVCFFTASQISEACSRFVYRFLALFLRWWWFEILSTPMVVAISSITPVSASGSARFAFEQVTSQMKSRKYLEQEKWATVGMRSILVEIKRRTQDLNWIQEKITCFLIVHRKI